MTSFKTGDRVMVTDSSTGKLDAGTIVRVWPNYSGRPEEKECFDIKLDAPWSGSMDGLPVMRIGRTEKTLTKIE